MVSTSDVVVSEVPIIDGAVPVTKEVVAGEVVDKPIEAIVETAAKVAETTDAAAAAPIVEGEVVIEKPVEVTDEEFENAQKQFQLGKKNLFLNKYDEAVKNIGDACEVFSAKYGEMDAQCAEIYFYYGRALLELARVENTVLGNALTGVPEDNTEINDSRYGNPDDINADEKKTISEDVINALCEPNNDSDVEKKDSEEEAKPMEGTETTVEAAVSSAEVVVAAAAAAEEEPIIEATKPTTTEATPAAETAEKKEDATATADDAEDDEECEDEDDEETDQQVKDEAENEEISSLQRSWEMFELAKLVYSKGEDVCFKNKRIAECLLKLGEISIEQESYEQAITDLAESIKLQEAECIPKETRDERMLAETFYQWGLAQQFNNMFTEAGESFQKSINIIQLKTEKLKGKLQSTEWTGEQEEEKKTISDEIAEMDALIPEITCKLEEVLAQNEDSAKLIKEAKECFSNSIANGTAPVVAAPVAETNGDVKDITSMVKSKRKIGECTEEETSGKKTRLSDANDEAPAVVAAVEKMDTPAAEETTAKPEGEEMTA
jgi:tetratricopeptide (TPR) repeat protein